MNSTIKSLKVAVINLSGNTGKTMVTEYLLKPRINESKIFSIETINSSGLVSDSETIKGKNFLELINTIVNYDSVIVDVGSSNVEQFIEQLNKFDGIHEEFDFFVIPTVPANKQITDTKNTVKFLSSIGIEKERIKVVLNKVDDIDSIKYDFKELIDYHQKTNGFCLNLNAVIGTNEFYQLNSKSGKTIAEILSDDRDLRRLIKESEPHSEERLALGNTLAIKRLASGVEKQLDSVFHALFLA